LIGAHYVPVSFHPIGNLRTLIFGIVFAQFVVCGAKGQKDEDLFSPLVMKFIRRKISGGLEN